MELSTGQALAGEIITALKPYCDRIEVAGSIRRRKRMVNDIDIVLIPRDPWGLNCTLAQLGRLIVRGPKIQRFQYQYAQVDLYFASRETWATLLLIRTGSKENNIRLCRHAQNNGMRLHADGSGLYQMAVQGCEGKEVRIAGDTEVSIYLALGLPYQRPEER